MIHVGVHERFHGSRRLLTQKNILPSVMVVGFVSSPLDLEKSLKS